jgi:hypothetical protein
VFALHTLVSSDDVADGENADVPHVQLAAGIGEHRQAVKLFFIRILVDLEASFFIPEPTCFGFDILRLVSAFHYLNLDYLTRAQRTDCSKAESIQQFHSTIPAVPTAGLLAAINESGGDCRRTD